jgi:hypothetical protein
MNTANYPNSLPQRFGGELDSEARHPLHVAAESEQRNQHPSTAEELEVFYDDREVYGGY